LLSKLSYFIPECFDQLPTLPRPKIKTNV
jgi:hypothetical protein